MLHFLFDWIYHLGGLLESNGWNPALVKGLSGLSVLLVLVAAAIGIYWLVRWVFWFLLVRVRRHGAGLWAEVLLKRKTLSLVCYFVLVLVYKKAIPFIFDELSSWIPFMDKVFSLLALYFAMRMLISVLWTIYDLRKAVSFERTVAMKGLIQFVGILVYFLSGIVAVSIIVDKNPLVFIGGLSAASAVLMLVFKDSITGLVAGVQIQRNDMVRIGDWITMPAQGVDGNVMDISLTTVKVQNFDLTILTIPTYSLISQPVQNWRGIQLADSRRMKREIHLDLTTIRFCTAGMFEDFKRMRILQPYLQAEESKVKADAQEKGAEEWDGANAYCPTNAEVWMKYVELYLRHHPRIRKKKDFTLLVRQLPFEEVGMTVEIYCYTDTSQWVAHEAIVTSIMNHVVAVLPLFGLGIYQRQGQGYPKEAGKEA